MALRETTTATAFAACLWSKRKRRLTNEATTTIARADLIAFLEASGHPPRVVAVSAPAD